MRLDNKLLPLLWKIGKDLEFLLPRQHTRHLVLVKLSDVFKEYVGSPFPK